MGTGVVQHDVLPRLFCPQAAGLRIFPQRVQTAAKRAAVREGLKMPPWLQNIAQ
jgi:hypothetical protein